MTKDQAVAEIKRLVYERNKGTLSVADYRHLRSCLLDELVGMSPSATDVEPTHPRRGLAPAPAFESGSTRRVASWRFATGAAILVALMGLAVWMLRSGKDL